MTLHITPSTEKGRTQIETIEWAEAELNRILKLVITEGTITKGINVKIKVPKEFTQQELEKGKNIEMTVTNLEPVNADEFEKLVDQVRVKLKFTRPVPTAEIVEEK